MFRESSPAEGPRRIKPLKLYEKIFILSNLATLIKSGMSLPTALQTTAEDAPTKNVRVVSELLRSGLERGSSLSAVLTAHPQIFDRITIALFEAGEVSGNLEKMMSELARRLDEDQRTVSRIRGALLYPALLLVVIFFLFLVITFFVIPRLSLVFSKINVELPVTTRIIFAFGERVNRNPFLTFLSLALVILALVGLVVSGPGKRFLRRLAFKLPVVKNMAFYLDLSRFSSTLAMMIGAGIPIQKGLEISAKVVGNAELAQQIGSAGTAVVKGVTVAEALKGGVLPRTFISLIAVGEKSGTINRILTELSVHYQQKLEDSIRSFTSLIEPVLTVFVGITVGAIVISVVLPIYQLIGRLGLER